MQTILKVLSSISKMEIEQNRREQSASEFTKQSHFVKFWFHVYTVVRALSLSLSLSITVGHIQKTFKVITLESERARV